MQMIIIILGVLCLVFFIENARELRTFRIRTYRIFSHKLKGIQKKRIVFLSDLHNCSYGKNNGRLLAAVRRSRPDLILIGGDMLVRKNGTSYAKTLKFLTRLTAMCPVYYANGNHEQKLKEEPERYEQSYAAYKKHLEEAGIIFLENEAVIWKTGRARIRISGLEIPLSAYEKLGKRNLSVRQIEDRIGRSDPSYQILLAHNPAYVQQYEAWGADLVLSGHVHGGLVGLPWIGGVISPDFRLFPAYSAGIYRNPKTDVVVSRGLGVHSVPIRFMNPAELVVLELRGDD